jgi:sugar lactone lactonase YvrE
MCGITKYRLKALLAMQVVLFSLHAQSIITTIAGNGTAGYNGDNIIAVSAELNDPATLVIDSLKNLYISDNNNNRIRKINTSGFIMTIAGIGTAGYSGDGGQATLAEINSPSGITIDKIGNLYFSDFFNNRIRKVNTSGVINTIAGNGTTGYTGDGGQATTAEINAPLYLTIDDTGNIYFGDNNRVVRKVNTSGIINTIAGTGMVGYSGDGGAATAAEFSTIGGIKIDNKGNLFISDIGNYRIRKINTAGIITTIAGTGASGYSGDGGQATDAKLDAPGGIVFDDAGNLFLTDEWNNVIRKIDTTGVITTIVGTGTAGYSGDGTAATSAELNFPIDIAFDKQGNLYINDNGNNRIRKVTNVGQFAGIEQVKGNSMQLAVYPNPNNGSFSISSSISIDEIKITDMLGQIMYEAKPQTEKTTLQLDNSGVYFITITAGKEITTQKVIVNK